jgi:hypothetical protein
MVKAMTNFYSRNTHHRHFKLVGGSLPSVYHPKGSHKFIHGGYSSMVEQQTFNLLNMGSNAIILRIQLIRGIIQSVELRI